MFVSWGFWSHLGRWREREDEDCCYQHPKWWQRSPRLCRESRRSTIPITQLQMTLNTQVQNKVWLLAKTHFWTFDFIIISEVVSFHYSPDINFFRNRLIPYHFWGHPGHCTSKRHFCTFVTELFGCSKVRDFHSVVVGDQNTRTKTKRRRIDLLWRSDWL